MGGTFITFSCIDWLHVNASPEHCSRIYFIWLWTNVENHLFGQGTVCVVVLAIRIIFLPYFHTNNHHGSCHDNENTLFHSIRAGRLSTQGYLRRRLSMPAVLYWRLCALVAAQFYGCPGAALDPFSECRKEVGKSSHEGFRGCTGPTIDMKAKSNQHCIQKLALFVSYRRAEFSKGLMYFR